MKTTLNYFLFTFFTLNIFLGFQVYAVPYDYSYVLGCVPKPEAPQYKGGIVVNPEFDEELKGWGAVGNAKIATAKSPDGNAYAVVSNIVTPQSDGLSLAFNVEKDKLYTVSAWFQITEGEAAVEVKVVTSSGNKTANFITAKAGCWTMFKGGFHVNVTEPAALHFDTNTTGFDMWVDSISLQPFTQEEWNSHQAQSLEKVRKAKVKFEVADQLGKAVADASVGIKQREPHFPFGCAMNFMIVKNEACQKWFIEKGFRYSVFENELKWQATELKQGEEDYSVADAMLEFAKKHEIRLRGHNIVWDDPKYLPEWLKVLPDEQKREAAMKRANSVVSRYKGQFFHWDVINENMHYNNISRVTNHGADIFNLLHHLDPLPIPFLNEYNVIEDVSLQSFASTWKYLQKIDEIRKAGYNGPLGIGLESHFNYVEPNFPYIRASIDMLYATGFPIWITEFDVDSLYNKIMLRYMEPLLHELHSHPYVNGIIVWGAIGDKKDGCWKMCLTDTDYKNEPAGDVLDKFMSEFIRVPDTNGKTDTTGAFETSLFHGEYEVTVTRPDGAQAAEPQTFNLMPGGDVTTVKFKTR